MRRKKHVLEKSAFKKRIKLHMEMFDVHRRDILNFDNYMDLKKPGFGGPNSAKLYRDAKGNKVNKEPKLAGFQRTVERDPIFAGKHYDSTYKAMTHDLVYKQEKKKPVEYRDPYITAIPVTNIAMKEGKSCPTFSSFVNEMYYGANPAEEQKVALRGKTDLDAIGDAEDKLDAAKIDWQDFSKSGNGSRVDYVDADGDLVAYVDIPSRKLYIMPDAATIADPIAPEEDEISLDDEQYTELPATDRYNTELEKEEEEEEEDSNYYKSDDDFNEPEDEFTEPESNDVADEEALLRSFETGDEDYDDEDEEY